MGFSYLDDTDARSIKATLVQLLNEGGFAAL